MERYDEATYGERIAAVYDEWYSDYEEAAVDLLQELAGRGRALELGIGTGRVALPLCHRGVEVTGIDASAAMIEKLRAKSGGADIEVVQGDFAEFELDARFDLIYVLFNTFYALLTQEEQVRCFQSVAQHLTQEGVFLIEAFVPDLSRFDRGQTVRAVHLSEDVVRLDATRHNLERQQISSQHVVLSEGGVRLYPVKLRYAWPSEFDLMARLAGLKLKQRWGSWDKDKFTADSGKHISVYGMAG
jgi:SAM-dependent methyltransferase